MNNILIRDIQMISLPKKAVFEVDLAGAIKSYAKKKFKPNDLALTDAGKQLNQLRKECFFTTYFRPQDQIDKLFIYHDQLVAFDEKIHFGDNFIKAGFKWENAFFSCNVTLNDGFYERSCVLYYIGAFCSKVAATQQLDTENGLKEALRLYKLAAECFLQIKNCLTFLNEMPKANDLHPKTMNVLLNLMLSQAQEVGFVKCVFDKMSNLNKSKIAAKCADYYGDTLIALNAPTVWFLKEKWSKLIKFKHLFYRAIAVYYKALDDWDEFRIGNALARLKQSRQDLKEIDSKFRTKTMEFFLKQSKEDLEKLKKENKNFHQHEITNVKNLELLERFDLAKSSSVQIKFPMSKDFVSLVDKIDTNQENNNILKF
ncbi:unnamed protein product [Brachionus calyciflorus]|uniref:BRO1 domain-containing protein n=1 Tax=Brachionus calyciflorus TaxID=104777 RepID=A0A813N2K5_9BILA|nr:unnamed protein product [Brachionus calyciflorus]